MVTDKKGTTTYEFKKRTPEDIDADKSSWEVHDAIQYSPVWSIVAQG